MAKINEKTMGDVKTINTMGFNEEKTRELIEEMKEQGINVDIENLAQYVRQQGLIVKVHVGGGKNDYELSPKVYGINENDLGDEVKELFSEHVKKSKIGFLPNAYAKRLKNLESNLRMQCRRNSIGYDNSFMAMPSYREFRDYYNKSQEDYMKIRDEIMDKYDLLVQRFKEITWISLEKLNAIDLDSEYHKIVDRFGGKPGDRLYEMFKEKYKDNFYMSLSVKAFPVTENLDMFEDDIKEQIQDGLNQETVQTLYEIIGNSLNDAFSSVEKVIISAGKNDGRVAPKTLSSITDTIPRLKQKNIFSNVKINEIADNISNMIVNPTDSDTLLQEAEIILAKIYSYAVELNIEHLINLKDSPLDEEILLEIAEASEETGQLILTNEVDEWYLIPDESDLFEKMA